MALDKVATREMLGKVVVSEEGRRFGVVGDVSFIAESGELMNIIIAEPTKNAGELGLQENDAGNYLVPFSAVKNVGDFVIISEKDVS
ncbi:MAG: PRC-barrel domain-containing protein [Candidatus Aenigmarchaeota archaeon]|nr:PRC-barrel domain-containing protein [Candidatus Aenigmarchaeota archaeon]